MKKLLLLLIPVLLFAQSATITSTLPVGLEITSTDGFALATGKMVTYLNNISSVLDTAVITYEVIDTIQCTLEMSKDTAYTVTVHSGLLTSSKTMEYSESITGTNISAVFKTK